MIGARPASLWLLVCTLLLVSSLHPAVLAVSETWLNNTVLDGTIILPDSSGASRVRQVLLFLSHI